MNIRRIIPAFAAALAVLAGASLFRFELVAINESTGVYRLDRWTGSVELIRGPRSDAVTGEDDKPLGLIGALTPNWWERDEIVSPDTGLRFYPEEDYTPTQAPAAKKWGATEKKAAVAGVVGAAIGTLFAVYLVVSALVSRLRKRRVAVSAVAVESKQ